jgi:hypothetical protein
MKMPTSQPKGTVTWEGPELNLVEAAYLWWKLHAPIMTCEVEGTRPYQEGLYTTTCHNLCAATLLIRLDIDSSPAQTKMKTWVLTLSCCIPGEEREKKYQLLEVVGQGYHNADALKF